jgi:hypothetical protein
MNYFNPYPLCVDNTVTTAWKSQIAEAAKTPSLAELLAQRGGELFPRFASAYTELRALPRGARRALQRRLAHSRELSAVLQEWLQQQSSRALQQKLAATLAGAALLLVLGRGVAEANNITVTTNVPAVNIGDGKCSLIEAIINANDTVDGQPIAECPPADPAGEDIIVLPKKTFTLTAPYDTYYGDPTGLPLITSKITIEGNGAKITRKKSAPSFRLMAVGSTGDLELEKVTLSGGGITYGGGGAVYNYGELTVTDSTITGNNAFYGGGIYNHGSLTVTNSTISKNTVKSILYNGYYYGGFAGGIANHTTGTFTVTNSTLTGNKAIYSGAIANYGGTMEINGSTVSKNTALYAGGIGNYGSGTIANSTISGNKANAKTIKVKYAGYTYTYIIGGVGGGVLNFVGNLSITNSTISGNKATGKSVKIKGYGTNFYGGRGGGVYNSGNLNLYGGTVTGNSAKFYGGGIFAAGTLNVNNSNVSGNNAKVGPDIYYY